MHPALRQAIPERSEGWDDESWYRELFAEAPIACFSVGVEGRIRAANKQALRLVGYRLSDVLGRPVLDLYADTPAGKAKAEEQFLQFRSGAEVRATELEMRRMDGTSVWISLSVRPIRDRKGRVAASCSVVEEITKQLSSPSLARFQQDDNEVFVNSVERFAPIRHLRPEQGSVKRLLIKSGSTSYLLRMDDIEWIGAAGNYVELHVANKSYLMRKTMNVVEAKLDPRQFLRIHRSVIVNVERIKELRPWHYGDHRIVLFDGTQLTLKRCHTEKLEKLVGERI